MHLIFCPSQGSKGLTRTIRGRDTETITKKETEAEIEKEGLNQQVKLQTYRDPPIRNKTLRNHLRGELGEQKGAKEDGLAIIEIVRVQAQILQQVIRKRRGNICAAELEGEEHETGKGIDSELAHQLLLLGRLPGELLIVAVQTFPLLREPVVRGETSRRKGGGGAGTLLLGLTLTTGSDFRILAVWKPPPPAMEETAEEDFLPSAPCGGLCDSQCLWSVTERVQVMIVMVVVVVTDGGYVAAVSAGKRLLKIGWKSVHHMYVPCCDTSVISGWPAEYVCCRCI